MDKEGIARGVGVVGGFTLLSRISGFLRDVIIANLFGAGLYTDAFFAAFRIPNILRRLLAEGTLTISFVPIFTEYLANKSKEEAFDLVNISFSFISILLIIVSIIGIIFSPIIVKIITPGFSSYKFDLTVLLNRIMFPYIFFIGLVALSMGILNSLKHFLAPALSPVLLNISMILSAVLLYKYTNPPIIALALGVIIGGCFQFLLQIPFLIKKGLKFRFNLNYSHPAIKEIFLLALPASTGAAVYQINIFVSLILASFLKEGSISYLYYANRLIELPLGVFAVALGTVVLPAMSKQASLNNIEEFKETFAFSVRFVLFFTIPAMIGLIVLGVPVINILFERGRFNFEDTILTSKALFFYSLGLWAISLTRITSTAFYSLKDTKTPVKAATLSFLVGIVASVILMFPLKHAGLALATSIASFVNIGILVYLFNKKIGGIDIRAILSSVSKITISSTIMGIILYILYDKYFILSSPLIERISLLGGIIILGILIFISISYIIKCKELFFIVDLFKK
jgi:putative peptidoglycan lipid II flippase